MKMDCCKHINTLKFVKKIKIRIEEERRFSNEVIKNE